MINLRGSTKALCLVALVWCVLAQTISVAAASQRTLLISGPPFPTGWMYLENGKVGGLRLEFFDKIARHAGYQWKGELYPAKRLMESIIHGKVDLSMLVLNPLLDKPEHVLTSREPVYTENLNLYGQKGTPPVQYRSDLQGKEIVVMRGYGYGGFKTWLDAPENNVKQYEADSFASAIQMLLRRDLDYALLYDLNFEAALIELASQPDSHARAMELSVTNWSKVPVYFHLSREALSDAEEVLARLMRSFHTLQEEGKLPPVEPMAMPGDRP